MEDGGLISQMKSGTELLPIQDLCRLCMNSATDDCFEIYENGEEVFELKHICEVLLQAKVDFSDTCLNKICLQCVADLKVCERMMEQLKNATYYLKLIERHSLYIKSEPPDESSFDGSQREDTNLRIPREAYVMTLETFLTDYDDAEQYLKDISQSEEVIFPPEHQPEDGENTLQMEGDSDEARVKLEPSEDLSEVEIVDVDSEENSVDFVELPSRKRKKSCRKAGPSSKQAVLQKNQRKYAEEDLQRAILAVKVNNLRLVKAARMFGVPYSTLHDKVTGKTLVGCRKGRKPKLSSEQECQLARWMVETEQAGLLNSNKQLLNSAAELLGGSPEVRNRFSTRNANEWLKMFTKRHPEICKKAQKRVGVREETEAREWFSKVETNIRNKGLLSVFEDPSRIFHAGERSYALYQKRDKVVLTRHDRFFHKLSERLKRRWVTVLLTASGAGIMAPPMVVYDDDTPADVAESVPSGWMMATSKSGWTSSENFYDYIVNVFTEWLDSENIKRPVVLFVDGRVAQVTIRLSTFCAENGIELVSLLVSMTYNIEPLDLCVFQVIEAEWKKLLKTWQVNNGERKMEKEDFALMFQAAVNQLVQPESIAASFKLTGLIDLKPYNY